MKCPYIVNRNRMVQTQIEYDDDGKETGAITVENNTAEFAECQKEQCGAWQNGVCKYKE